MQARVLIPMEEPEVKAVPEELAVKVVTEVLLESEVPEELAVKVVLEVQKAF